MHRSEVIRYVVTKNLSSAISGYKNYYNSTVEYIMPKISETETIDGSVAGALTLDCNTFVCTADAENQYGIYARFA